MLAYILIFKKLKKYFYINPINNCKYRCHKKLKKYFYIKPINSCKYRSHFGSRRLQRARHSIARDLRHGSDGSAVPLLRIARPGAYKDEGG
jgi:hypothetical protein